MPVKFAYPCGEVKFFPVAWPEHTVGKIDEYTPLHIIVPSDISICQASQFSMQLYLGIPVEP